MKRSKTRLPAVFLGLLATAELCLLIWGGVQIWELKRAVDAQTRRLEQGESRVGLALDSAVDRVEGLLKRETEILSDYTCEVVEINPEARICTLRLSATPKVWREGMKVSFSVRAEGEEPIVLPAKGEEGLSFHAQTELALNDKIEVMAMLEQGGEVTTQKLDGVYGTAQAHQLKVGGGKFEGSYGRSDGVLNFRGKVTTFLKPSELSDGGKKNVAKSANAVLSLNGKSVFLSPMETRSPDGEAVWEAKFETGVQTVPGDEFEVAIEAKDSFGWSYRVVLIQGRVEPDGGLSFSQEHGETVQVS